MQQSTLERFNVFLGRSFKQPRFVSRSLSTLSRKLQNPDTNRHTACFDDVQTADHANSELRPGLRRCLPLK